MNRTMLALAGATLAMAGAAAQAQDLAAGKAVFDKFNCASCHGADAKSAVDPAYPTLAGQHADYLVHALKAYKRGASGSAATANVRKNPIMGAFAAQLSDQDINNVAAWLSSQPSDLGVRKEVHPEALRASLGACLRTGGAGSVASRSWGVCVLRGAVLWHGWSGVAWRPSGASDPVRGGEQVPDCNARCVAGGAGLSVRRAGGSVPRSCRCPAACPAVALPRPPGPGIP